MPGSPPALETADWLRLDQHLCFALYSSSLAMTRLYTPHLAPLGLTYPQYLVLLAMWERDSLTVGELCEHLTLDSGTLTPLLKRMEASGWLTRKRDPADERRVIVSLTPPGRALREKARLLPRQLAQASGCHADEARELTNRLQALRKQLHGVLDAGPSTPR